MDNDKILHFIAEKIEDIRLAIFYCHSNSTLKINNTIIHTYRVDDNGNITFFINRPQQLIREFDQEFPVGLNYFKKGKNCFLNIFGKARIINDPEELAYETDLSPEEINSALTTHILIRVKILKVDFYDNDFEKKNLLLKKAWSVFAKLFDSLSASRSYDLSPRSSLHHFGI
ncbi:MAG: hypothetical protein JWQ40_93 [Segetibacter sp.]|jgi:hypothetical protein|nr:hypothetical protein [Segetibacter sp.]